MTLIEEAPFLKKNFKHDIDVVIDRFVVRKEASARLADSLETALGLTDGLAAVENADDGSITIFSSRFACPETGFTIPEIEPRLFSFNNPFGACPVCDGIGTEQHCDAELVVPNPLMSLRDGAIAPWATSSSSYYEQTLDGICKHYKVSMKTAFGELPEDVREAILFGSKEEVIPIKYDDGLRSYTVKKPHLILTLHQYQI